MFLKPSTDGDDSITELDKVTKSISQLAISVNPSIDKHPSAIIKVSEPAEYPMTDCSESWDEVLRKKIPDNPRNQKGRMGTRWKGKGAEKKALSEPISATMSQLQSSFLQSNTRGILTTTGILLDINDPHQTDLLTRACLGRPYATSDKDNTQWFQLSNEEAFYLSYTLKCIKIAENDTDMKDKQVFIQMSSNQKNFVNLFKGYCHLRLKNWVVRSGSQYGVDFVAYRHHPSLVHSEYAVIVLSDDDDDDGGDANGRLRVWSDVHCTLRLCGNVAKTLLVLNIKKYGKKGVSLANLESYAIEERTITRWSPELAKEGK